MLVVLDVQNDTFDKKGSNFAEWAKIIEDGVAKRIDQAIENNESIIYTKICIPILNTMNAPQNLFILMKRYTRNSTSGLKITVTNTGKLFTVFRRTRRRIYMRTIKMKSRRTRPLNLSVSKQTSVSSQILW